MTEDRENPFAGTADDLRGQVKCKGFEIENCQNKRKYDRGIYGGLCLECAERKKGGRISSSRSPKGVPHRATKGTDDSQVNLEQVVAMMDLGVEMIFKVGDRKFRLQEVRVEDQ